jgi:manganese oxidase
MPDPLNTRSSRRSFLASGAVGAAAFYCTIGKEQVALEKPGDAAKADAAAARVARPPGARRNGLRAAAAATGTGEAVDTMQFGQPVPKEGGRYVEYWIQAREVRWNIVPTGKDAWHGVSIPGKNVFTAVAYQLMTPGFAATKAPPSIPGPTLYAEVGDVIVCHFRNNLTKLNQAITMHPHGVKYTPDYDGAYMGDFTRIGGFIAPGEEFTYRWEVMDDSVGVWPYHDHGPNHTLNTMRGLFGALVIREKGAKAPDVENTVFFHQFSPSVTGLKRAFSCINGRAYAGNTPTLRAKVGQDVAFHCIGMDNDFHDFHIHGHRWQGDGRAYTDNPSVGPNETATARFVEDNPGRWLYHCHVFSHQDNGMTGYYIVEP